MDTSDTPMRYQGPLDLAHAHTKLNHVSASEEGFTRDGPRADNEYRDLGLAAASGGRIGAKHIRAIRPFEQPTGWHWHDMTGALRGRPEGLDHVPLRRRRGRRHA